MSKVFISYSRIDREFGEKLHLYLASREHDVWRDEEDMPPTSKMWEEIEYAIKNTDNFIFIMSPNSIASPSCNHELDLARSFPKRVIPVLLTKFNEREALIDLTNTPLTNFQQSLFKNRDLLQIGRENLTLLGSIDWIIFVNPDEFEKQFEKLHQALNTDLKYVKLHTRYRVGAEEWEKDAYNPKRLLLGKERIAARKLLRYPEGIKPEITDSLRKFIGQSRCAEIEAWRETKRKKHLISQYKLWLKRLIGGSILIVILLSVFLALLYAQAQLLSRRITMSTAINYRVRGSNSYLAGDFIGAQDLYQRALDTLKPLETISPTMDWSRYNTSEYKENKVVIDEWLQNLGLSCAQRLQPDLQCATDYLQAAIKVNRGNTDARLALADIYREQGKIADAKVTLQSAIDNGQYDPNFIAKGVFLSTTKAKIAYSDGQYTEAVDTLNQWIDSFEPTPDTSDIGFMSSYYLDMLYYRAKSYEALGKDLEACADWKDFQATVLSTPPTLKLLWFSKEQANAAEAVKNCN